MRLPFVSRYQYDRMRELFFDELDDLNQALAANGVLRRRVASLELENQEFRRQVASLKLENQEFRRQVGELDAGQPRWW